jgi:hypothetical protein
MVASFFCWEFPEAFSDQLSAVSGQPEILHPGPGTWEPKHPCRVSVWLIAES